MKERTTLKIVQDKLKQLMYLEDDCQALDLLLATTISRKQKNSKIWIILVAPTGMGKSEITKGLENEKNDIKIIRKLTTATLVSGRKDKGRNDLAPKLQDKVLMIPDLAQLLKLPTDTKAQLFSQLVDLYDGIASTTAYGVEKYYEGLNISFIGCSTYAIQNQFLLFSYLGTRFLCYNMNIKNKKKLLKKIEENLETGKKEQYRAEYKEAVTEFLQQTQYEHLTIVDSIRKEIQTWGEMLTKIRTTGNTENTSGDLTEIPHEELPTRIIEQLETIYRSLKSLDPNYTDQRAIEIIKNIVLSSTNRLRIKVLKETIKHQETEGTPLSRKELSQKLGIGFKQVYRELNFLTHSGLLKRNDIYKGENKITGEEIYYNTWEINKENKCIKLLKKHMKIPTITEEEIK